MAIIHFTNNFKTLKDILRTGGFRPFYCREVLYSEDTVASSAVHPMVSFSKQIIRTIDNKNITYGEFGIGLKKSWIDKNKIHPVLYLDKSSHIAKALASLLKARRKNAETVLAPSIRSSIMTIKCFTKNTVGYNSYFEIDNFNFRAENEWRYVPTKEQIKGNLVSQSRRKYEKNPDLYDDKLRDYPLEFSKDDIMYIFVRTGKQKDEIARIFNINKAIIRISGWSTAIKKATVSS